MTLSHDCPAKFPHVHLVLTEHISRSSFEEVSQLEHALTVLQLENYYSSEPSIRAVKLGQSQQSQKLLHYHGVLRSHSS